jgi:histidyl-tRNA synthetase
MSFTDVVSLTDLHHVSDPNLPEYADAAIYTHDGVSFIQRNIDQTSYLRKKFADSPVAIQGLDELDQIASLVESAGYGTRRIRIDPSVVRGLEYYTGPVYEAELLAEIPNDEGQIVRFGSVGGGGRYDGLVSRFRGEPVPATGFSIGVSRLTAALKNLGKLDTSDAIGPVVVLAMDRDTDSLGRYQKMVAELRRAGIRAEMYLGGAGMKAQMKYADRRGSPCVVIQGGDERAKGVVQIKDLVEGARLAEKITDNAEWREGRPAQVEVAESELVETVKAIIAAQKAERSGG